MELNRRNKVANAKHFLAIYLNNVQVTRTVVKQFRSQDFTITFNGTKDLAESSKIKNLRGSDTRLVFGIQISHFPESFVAKLYEQVVSIDSDSKKWR